MPVVEPIFNSVELEKKLVAGVPNYELRMLKILKNYYDPVLNYEKNLKVSKDSYEKIKIKIDACHTQDDLEKLCREHGV